MAEEKQKPEPTPPEPVDDLVATSHTLVASGRELRYTARAGRVVLRREIHDDDKAFSGHLPKAEVFLTAYTLDDADPRGRPVTFAFNGGPGSSSVWLHLGLLGPRRVLAGDAGAPVPPPYQLADNGQSLLAHSDLVFIDPVSTGYSRALTGEKPADYHGYTGDVESVAEIIRLWTSRSGRWLSPKYLCGESYGTFRAVAVAKHLHERFGMYLNGLILISSILNIGEAEFDDQNDVAYPLYLPTYAAIANYHGRHGDRPLAEVLAEAEAYAARDYPWVLSRGTRLSTVERTEAAARLAQLTGLSADYLDRVELRVEHIRFFTELLRSRRRTVGRLDGRFLGWETDYGVERWRDDPAMQAILGPYTAAINHYLRAELRYSSDLPYEALSDVMPWSFKEFEGRHASVADLLGRVLRGNPHLRVYVACGYYDGATPYFAAEHTFAHLRIPEELHGNIEFHYFEAGHMMYVHEPSRLAQSTQLGDFVSR
ncbi:MAG: peptidase S10 [Micromonosporaceae bacterium]|nr:peptidase S10 [Micromonosporaceae bacterium]